MKIEAIPSNTAGGITPEETQVIRLKVTGPVDPADAILRRARELVLKTGSVSMKESFDWALSTGAFVSEK